MKKTFRTAVAMLLALIIACSSLTAFAQTPGDIEWYFGDDEPWIYSYAGALTVGEETVLPPVSEAECVYLTMEIEETGYYKITVDSDVWYGVPEINDNGAYENVLEPLSWEEYDEPRYYYLEEGETIVGFDLYEDRGVAVNAEYLGDITAVEFDRGLLENRLLEYNIYKEEEGNYILEAENVTVKFALGEEYFLNWATIVVYAESGLVKGENAVEIGIWGTEYREEVTLGVIEITDIIASVEFENFKDYAYLTVYYDGSIYAPDIEYETLTVTYTDGTVETLEGFTGYEFLQNCEYDIYVGYEEIDGEWIAAVYVANQRMLEEPCVVENATTSENLTEFKDEIFDVFREFINWADGMAGEVIGADSIGETLIAMLLSVRHFISEFAYIFREIFGKTVQLIGSLF